MNIEKLVIEEDIIETIFEIIKKYQPYNIKKYQYGNITFNNHQFLDICKMSGIQINYNNDSIKYTIYTFIFDVFIFIVLLVLFTYKINIVILTNKFLSNYLLI